MKKIVSTTDAPGAIGPYNQAVISGNMVFTAGQIALDPTNGQIVGDDIASQTEQVMKNLTAILTAAGSSMQSVIKTTVFLKSMDHFPEMNKIYGAYFPDDPPARSTVEVSRLPKDVLVEVECIAIVGS